MFLSLVPLAPRLVGGRDVGRLPQRSVQLLRPRRRRAWADRDRYRGCVSEDISETGHDVAPAADEMADEMADEAASPATRERPYASVPQPTGVQTVDAAVERLAELDALPTNEHVAVYDAVHRQLQDALADLDGA